MRAARESRRETNALMSLTTIANDVDGDIWRKQAVTLRILVPGILSVMGIYQQFTDLTHCFAYPNFFFSQSRSSISSWPYSVSSLG